MLRTYPGVKGVGTSVMRFAVVGASAALLVAPAASSSASVVNVPYLPVAGPVVGDGRLGWVDGSRIAGDLNLDVRVAGEPAQSLTPEMVVPGGLAGAFGGVSERAGLAIDGSTLAVEVTFVGSTAPKDGSVVAAKRVFAAPRGGTLAPVMPPCTQSAFPGLPNVGLSGTRLGYEGPGCAQASVDDLATGERVTVPDGASQVRVHGDWIAWLEGAHSQDPTAVVARGDGTIVYHVASSQLPARGLIQAIDVDDDGAIALIYTDLTAGNQQRVATASSEQPAPQMLPLRLSPGAGVVAVRAVGHRVVALVGRGSTFRAQAREGSVLVYDRALGHPDTLATGVDASTVPPRLDADDTSIGFITRSCDSVQLQTIPFAGAPVRHTAASTCPLRIARSPRGSRDGLIRLTLSCRGFAPDCDIYDVRATPPGRPGRLLARDDLATGGRAALRLTRAGRQLTATRRSFRVTLSAKLSDQGSPADTRSRTISFPGRR